MVDKSINNQDENQETIYKLNLENERLENELSHLENYIKNTKEWISVVMNWNLDRVERFLDNYSKLRIK